MYQRLLDKIDDVRENNFPVYDFGLIFVAFLLGAVLV